ncbi:glycosyltransferase family 4 protein [Spirosoma taeanense]|uniref:Glycosyltransferase family 4 protein n=1 Tax=Spirosoma taeanense TaxID=2735870 RepID=A0A6M5YC85_9BACT|nr:glycosyltransferase family 4 protein [Spirosoma taeanense]QJW91174.1 glycosyltransferase family 4 protein [Spirosoma taeanense]
MRHIVFICNELPPASSGGIGHFVAGMAQCLHIMGYKVTVIGMYYNKPYVENYPFNVIRLSRTRIKHIGPFFDCIRLQYYLKKLHKVQPIDVIEYPDYEGFGAYHFLNVPFVVRLHDSNFYTNGYFYGKRSLTLIMKWLQQALSIYRANIVVSVTDSVLKSVRKLVLIKKHSVIPNIVFDCYPVIKRQEFSTNRILLHVGTVSKLKGCDIILNSFLEIAHEFPDINLYFVGRIHYYELIEKVEKASMINRVVFLGERSRSEVNELLARASVCIFASERENMPLAWIEAMNMAKVLIVPNIPVATELVKNTIDGFIVNRTIKDYIDSLRYIFNLSSIDLATIGLKAKASVSEKYDMNSVVMKNIELWSAISKS